MKCKKKKYKSLNECYSVIYLMVKRKKAYVGDLEGYKCNRCLTIGNKIFYIGHKRGKLKISPKTWELIDKEL